MCCFTSSFISHFFHSSAHICHSFRILFEIAYTIGQCRIIHFRCIGAEKIVHQLPQSGLVFDLRIDIDNMSFIFKDIPGLAHNTVDVINRKTTF